MNLAFDTLAYSKKLREAGFTELQAEAQAIALAEIVDEKLATTQGLKELEANLKRDIKELETSLRHDMKELETSLRHDMKELETSLRHDIKELETSLRHDIKELESRIIIKLGGMMVVAIGLVATLVNLL